MLTHVLALLFSASPLSVSELARDPEWLGLLHSQKTSDGLKSSELELESFLKAIRSSTKIDDEHPICKFPARLAWVTAKGAFSASENIFKNCPKFTKWSTAIAAQSVSVVFSSYYMNNPSSAFGHTFLRLNKGMGATGGERLELLDYGINYAANIDTTNALLYGIKGLFGFFDGSFTSLPYYFKVREYADFESRDLWSYDLNLNPWQVQQLVRHLWELGSSRYQYLYLSKNCSFYVVHALNAIAPEYGLADRLKWYVLPSDSLKVIQDTPNLVSRISFRASARTQFLQRLNFLSHEEKRNLRNRLQDFEAEAALKSPDREARLLDAGADYFDFRFASDLQNENSRAAKLKKFWLQKRAEILSPSPALESKIWLKVTPDQGHGSLRASFSGGRDSHGESYLEVGFRGAFHDLLDRLEGYPESAEIEFFNFSFRNYWAQQKFRLTDATLFKAFSISPISQFEVSPSWRMHVFASSSQSRSCDFCISGTGETAGGFTLNLGSATLPVLWYSLASVQIEGSPRFRKHSVILSAGPETGLRFSWSQRHLSLLTAVSRYKVFFQEWEQFYSARHRSSISDSLAVEARVSESERSIDYGLGFFFYF